jgi:peptidyl-prolyl cis-trans isomerase A (cyclophilin A)
MKFSQKHLVTALLATSLVCASSASATVVLVKTSLGNFEVNLFDKTTPVTVNNFLTYVNDGSYNNTVFHRSLTNFVVQGGGYSYSGNNANPFTAIAQRAAINNEPKLSNVRGTIAMAKISSNVNSATNQWFINLTDNSSNLDLQNGGFTVFGQINAQGMEIIDNIVKLPTKSLSSAFPEVPLRNYTAADSQANKAVTASNIVFIENISVINNDVNSASTLTPKANTLINQPPASESSGGSMGFATLLLSLLVWRRRFSA